MPLAPGTRLGPYEVLGPLGAGGMGEVYKARDTRLDRTVAIKVLPEHLSATPDLRARFEREARARAAAEEIITPLRLLGFRAEEARYAAALCEGISDAPLEQRLRRALSCLQPRPRTPAGAPASLGSAP